MKMTLIAVALAGALVSGVGAADAQSREGVVRIQYSERDWHDRWDTLSIEERQARINWRIERGQQDGRLTNYEARRLLRQLSSIENKERAFRSDGHLDRRENAELNRDLDRLAMNLRNQMRDGDRRY